MPTRTQLEAGAAKVIRCGGANGCAEDPHRFGVPDYYAKYPKACMGGWGKKLMLIDPAGPRLPCHAADVIPGIDFENIPY